MVGAWWASAVVNAAILVFLVVGYRRTTDPNGKQLMLFLVILGVVATVLTLLSAIGEAWFRAS